MNAHNIAAIRAMIADGASNEEIADTLNEAEIDARAAEAFERDAYGVDVEDHYTPAQREFHDRLSLGRNDAGEWLGFM